MPAAQVTPKPAIDKENAPALVNVTPPGAKLVESHCPDEIVNAKPAPVNDEFDDEDALEALVAAENEEKST